VKASLTGQHLRKKLARRAKRVKVAM
jgi:hypothetical protein